MARKLLRNTTNIQVTLRRTPDAEPPANAASPVTSGSMMPAGVVAANNPSRMSAQTQ